MWSEAILHVDMDSFFVEVERLDDQSLVARPIAVGGTGPRGVIASASYEARQFGVHSAQPTSIALRLCPSLTVVPPRHGVYGNSSKRVFDVFRHFTPLIEGVSLDEAFLDVSGLSRHYESAVAVAEAIRAEVRADVGLPASVGIAASKLVAKLASEAAKPDGLRHVTLEDQTRFLHDLAVQDLPGVGPATLAALARLGVETIGDVAELPTETLTSALGPALGHHLHEVSNARDSRPVVPDNAAKSISVEETYDTDLEGRAVVEAALLALSQRLADRLHRAALTAKTITVKLRYANFDTPTRSNTSPSPVAGQHEITRIASSLLDELDVDRPIRLLGIGASGLESIGEPRQLDMAKSHEWELVDEAASAVRDRFGESAVSPARLMGLKDRTEDPS